jgi:hypothetical protein
VKWGGDYYDAQVLKKSSKQLRDIFFDFMSAGVLTNLNHSL